jgi:hypothetical protein
MASPMIDDPIPTIPHFFSWRFHNVETGAGTSFSAVTFCSYMQLWPAAGHYQSHEADLFDTLVWPPAECRNKAPLLSVRDVSVT